MTGNNLSGRIDGFIYYTLMRGCDDWVQAAEIVDNIFNLGDIFKKDVSDDILNEISIAEKTGGTKEFTLARDLSIVIIEKLLVDKLMVIGDPYDGFIPWEMNVGESIKYIKNIWDSLNGKLPGVGIYWLCNTQKGDQIGEQALLDWQQSRSPHN